MEQDKRERAYRAAAHITQGAAPARRAGAGARAGRGRAERRGRGRRAATTTSSRCSRALDVPHTVVAAARASTGSSCGRSSCSSSTARARSRRPPSPASARSSRRAAACSPPTGRSSTSSSRRSPACSPSTRRRPGTTWCASRCSTARTSTCRACWTARTTRSGGWRARRTPSAWSTRSACKVLITSRELGEKYGERPVAVWFRWGEGDVFHMISHYYLQRTEERTARHRGRPRPTSRRRAWTCRAR